MRSMYIKLFLVLSLTLPALSFAQALDNGTNLCGVPVCNIQEALKALKSLNGDQRGMYAINMKAAHKDASDPKVLENLYVFANEMKTLSESLNDEDWVLRAAIDLINTVVFNLAKFSEVDGVKLLQYYEQFGNQASRYGLISYWQNQLSSLEDVKTLEHLVVFADGARKHSIKVQDEDWVARAATALITEITVKLTNLDPAHEGVYDVELTEASKASSSLSFDRIAVLDSSSSKNLMVVFINSRLRVVVYSYSNAEIVGNTVSGLYLSNGDAANRFSFTFDRASGEISGAIESTRNELLEFSGNQIYSTRSVFAGNVPHVVTKNDVLGSLAGELAGVKGTLTVRSFVENVYSATFISENGSLVLNFQGKFFAKNGVLSLTSSDKLKLTLALRETANGPVWKGSSFSLTSGTTSAASFVPKK